MMGNPNKIIQEASIKICGTEVQRVEVFKYLCSILGRKKNAQMQTLFGQLNIVVKIKRGKIRCAGHVQGMPESRSVKKRFLRKLDGRRRRGRPRKRWIDDVEVGRKKWELGIGKGRP